MADKGGKRPEQLNLRISDEGKALVYALQEHFGLSQAGVMELIIRDRARAEGLVWEKSAHGVTVSDKSGRVLWSHGGPAGGNR